MDDKEVRRGSVSKPGANTGELIAKGTGELISKGTGELISRSTGELIVKAKRGMRLSRSAATWHARRRFSGDTLLVLALGGCAMFALPLTSDAHHSFAATYFTDRTITLKGEVVQFMYRNPHTLLQIIVTDDKGGEPVRWAIEWAATLALTQSGVTKDAIKPGDKVVVTGFPPRNPIDHRLRLKAIERPKDGWKWGGDFS
jgi:hypothetical protein